MRLKNRFVQKLGGGVEDIRQHLSANADVQYHKRLFPYSAVDKPEEVIELPPPCLIFKL
jgi:hypothetical protein